MYIHIYKEALRRVNNILKELGIDHVKYTTVGDAIYIHVYI
jgi:hypothetical protein